MALSDILRSFGETLQAVSEQVADLAQEAATEEGDDDDDDDDSDDTDEIVAVATPTNAGLTVSLAGPISEAQATRRANLLHVQFRRTTKWGAGYEKFDVACPPNFKLAPANRTSLYGSSTGYTACTINADGTITVPGTMQVAQVALATKAQLGGPLPKANGIGLGNPAPTAPAAKVTEAQGAVRTPGRLHIQYRMAGVSGYLTKDVPFTGTLVGTYRNSMAGTHRLYRALDILTGTVLRNGSNVVAQV